YARVFNDDALGGYIIWRSRRPVFIDGRLQVYPPEVDRENQTGLDDPLPSPAIVARQGITAVILYHPAPRRLEVAAAIAKVPGWRIAYVDGGAVVLLAGTGGAPAGGRRHTTPGSSAP